MMSESVMRGGLKRIDTLKWYRRVTSKEQLQQERSQMEAFLLNFIQFKILTSCQQVSHVKKTLAGLPRAVPMIEEQLECFVFLIEQGESTEAISELGYDEQVLGTIEVCKSRKCRAYELITEGRDLDVIMSECGVDGIIELLERGFSIDFAVGFTSQ
jgi:hypothetical protein